MSTLHNIGSKYGTDKVNYGYLDFYNRFFNEQRESMKNVLELGVYYGASMKMWREYFPNAKIYGVDLFNGIRPSNTPFANPDIFLKSVQRNEYDRIYLDILDQSIRENIVKYKEKFTDGYFDIIIDDCSHRMVDQQQSLGVLYPLVKSNGYYIIEDINSSLERYEDVKEDFSNTTLTVIECYFKKSKINSEYMTSTELEYINKNIKNMNFYWTMTPCRAGTCIITKS